MPKVSIILPTFNDLNYLKLSINSVLNQTYRDFEFVIVDDGSTDGTWEYLKTLNAPEIRIFHKENGGVSSALNFGISQSRGSLITWTSSDNLCSPFFLEALVAGIDSHPGSIFAYSSYYNINAEGKVTSVNISNHQFPNEMLTSSHRGNASFIYNKSCHDVVGRYITLPSCDTDMWVKLSTAFDVKSVYVVEPLYFYRMHNARKTESLGVDYYRNLHKVMFKETIKLYGWENLLNKIYKIFPSGHNDGVSSLLCDDMAVRYCKQGLPDLALDFWRIAIKYINSQSLGTILHNLSQFCLLYKIDPCRLTEAFQSFYPSNPSLISFKIFIEHLTSSTSSGAIIGASGFISNSHILRSEYSRRFTCFSFLNWKSGCYSGTANYSAPVCP